MSYQVLREAIIEKKQVICQYKGHQREVCPHVIGRKRGKPHVLTFQFAGGSSSGLPVGGEWRCMDVGEISGAVAREGEWHTGGRHTQPQTCVDQIDVEVSF